MIKQIPRKQTITNQINLKMALDRYEKIIQKLALHFILPTGLQSTLISINSPKSTWAKIIKQSTFVYQFHVFLSIASEFQVYSVLFCFTLLFVCICCSPDDCFNELFSLLRENMLILGSYVCIAEACFVSFVEFGEFLPVELCVFWHFSPTNAE